MLDTRSHIHRFVELHPWLIMATIVCGSLLLALGLVQLDERVDIDPPTDQFWIYGGTSDSAIGLLSAVASSAITVAGVVFSATFVTMQLASSQYTPRVVQALSRRWSLHVVLGLFLGNFLYSLIVLRSVRPPAADGSGEFVPVLSVSICVLFSMACVGTLVFYIAYGMRSLQPTFLIDSAAGETVGLLKRNLKAAREAQSHAGVQMPETDGGDAWTCTVLTAGFLQRVRFRKMLAIAEDAGLVIRLNGQVGLYYLPGEPILSAWPADACGPDIQQVIRDCVVLGPERTAEQDIEFGFRRVADIMIKALSPAINDPTTASYCINRLGELIVLLANQPAPQGYLVDSAQVVRVIWNPEPFRRCVHTAFAQTRFYMGTDVSLIRYTVDVLRRTTALIGTTHQEILLGEARRLRDSVLSDVTDPTDVAELREAMAWMDVIGVETSVA